MYPLASAAAYLVENWGSDMDDYFTGFIDRLREDCTKFETLSRMPGGVEALLEAANGDSDALSRWMRGIEALVDANPDIVAEWVSHPVKS